MDPEREAGDTSRWASGVECEGRLGAGLKGGQRFSQWHLRKGAKCPQETLSGAPPRKGRAGPGLQSSTDPSLPRAEAPPEAAETEG